jgi:hypothetical protein
LLDQVKLLRPEDGERSTRRKPARMFVDVDAPENINNADDIMVWLDKKAVIATVRHSRVVRIPR